MTRRRLALGESGEAIAARALRRAGYRILAERYSCPLGELDLVARDRDTLVFIEVKTRTSLEAGPPEAAVSRGKQRRIVKAAREYLRRRGQAPVNYRFDIVSVFWQPEGGYQLRLIKDAFKGE